MSERLFVQRLTDNAILPTRGSTQSAGIDLSTPEIVLIPPKTQVLVPTGLAFVIPEGYYGRVAPRSGISLKHGLIVNAGVIDSDYRGEVKVVVYNPTDIYVNLSPGQKFAQMILERILVTDPIEVQDVSDVSQTERGAGGFGSTDSRV